MSKDLNFVFFGSSHFSTIILDGLKKAGFLPTLIVSTEDKPKGRKMVLSPTETKIWAKENNIECFEPKTLGEENVLEKLKLVNSDLFIVASYGKIIPQKILDLPKHKTLNVHPSLLPKLRGASPVQSAILSENKTGITIISLDAKMDHGPIVAQIETENWTDDDPPHIEELKEKLGQKGGKLLADLLPDWISGKISPVEQDHEKATFCKKITKEDGLLNLTDSPSVNLRKIRAYNTWPTAYFFTDRHNKKIRVIVKKAKIENGELKIERVIPEGRKEMGYEDFMRG